MLKEKVAKVSLKSKSAIMKQHKGHRKQKPPQTASIMTPKSGSVHDADVDDDRISNKAKKHGMSKFSGAEESDDDIKQTMQLKPLSSMSADKPFAVEQV